MKPRLLYSYRGNHTTPFANTAKHNTAAPFVLFPFGTVFFLVLAETNTQQQHLQHFNTTAATYLLGVSALPSFFITIFNRHAVIVVGGVALGVGICGGKKEGKGWGR